MAFRTPDDAPDIESAIKYLFSNRQHTDFYFLSRDGRDKKHVHRLIVAIQSPVLSKLLFSNKPIEFLQMKYDDNFALQNLVSFFYNDNIVLENISDIKLTKAIADRFEVFPLSEVCKDKFIDVPVCLPDVLPILETAREFQNERKENECLRLISENQEEIFTSRQFLGLSFRRVLDIFEKIKRMNMMTEANFLHLAIRWLDTNGKTDNKELLMEKVNVTSLSLNDYLDILIEFPVFFTNVEISYAVKEIKSQHVDLNVSKISETIICKKECRDAETNTEACKSDKDTTKTKGKVENHLNKEELLADVNYFKQELNNSMQNCQEFEEKYNSLVIECESKNIEIDRQNNQIKDLERRVKKLQERDEPHTSLPYASLESKKKLLTIQILNQEDGVNVFDLEKRARIMLQEGSTIRSIQVAVGDILKKGLIGTVVDKKGNYSDSDVDISYEGVYFMLCSLKELDETLSPIQYIEVLKAALYFQLKDMAEKCIKRISGIVVYDPVFLDGLKALSCLKDKSLGLKGLAELKDKYLSLLLSEPHAVILHPNFTKCSVDLIMVLLQQGELKVKDESQLLLVIISWLEAQKEDRRVLRMTLLKNLAFENISTADFRYAIHHYPNFFDEKEKKLILEHRNPNGNQVTSLRDNLPEWYSTKTRRHI